MTTPKATVSIGPDDKPIFNIPNVDALSDTEFALVHEMLYIKYCEQLKSKWDDEAARIKENVKKNPRKYSGGNVTSYYTDKEGRHIEAGTGKVLSTRESRAKQDIPQWKKFEIGRLEDVDGHILPGPNALPKDIEQYGENIEKTNIHKTRGKKMRPETKGYIQVSNINSYGEVEVDIDYPDGFDELLCRAWISDDSTVSMRCHESEGSRHRETVTDAEYLTFMLPTSHGLEDAKEVKLHFYFRKSNTMFRKSIPFDCVRPRNVRKIETRKQDWDVKTGWEKRIKVDFPKAPDHPRWSDWTYKERDIVARKHHERFGIGEMHGFQSKAFKYWAKENEPIMIGFARDNKSMPDWAHAGYRPSGIPEYVQAVWEQPDIAGPGKWVYDPPGPWEDKGEEPEWSAIPDEVELPEDPPPPTNENYVEAANRYRESVGLPPVKESQSDKLRSALVEANLRPDVVVKELNPETGQLEEIQGTVPYKIMPDDDNFTPVEKSLNWASESQHGPAHCERWNRVAAALGADNGYDPMPEREVRKWWNHHGCNKRWSMAMEAIGGQDEVIKAREAGMERYNSKLSMQGNFSAEQWRDRYNADPIICKFEGYDDLTIYDIGAGGGMPNWWLDGPGEPSQLWRLEENGDKVFISKMGTAQNSVEEQIAQAVIDKNWALVASLAEKLT